jgi:hypothetical protein
MGSIESEVNHAQKRDNELRHSGQWAGLPGNVVLSVAIPSSVSLGESPAVLPKIPPDKPPIHRLISPIPN